MLMTDFFGAEADANSAHARAARRGRKIANAAQHRTILSTQKKAQRPSWIPAPVKQFIGSV
jgi:hypothetical protein